MKNLPSFITTGLGLCLLTGCATTEPAAQKHACRDYSGYILNLATGGTNEVAHPPALPIRLGVAQIGESAPPQAMCAALAADKKSVASVVGLPLPDHLENQSGHSVEKSPDANYVGEIKSVCHLAQAGGADYVFIFGHSVETWVKQNALSLFDCTFVGAEIIPGGKVNLQGRAAGTLIEAATGRPVFLISAECRRSVPTPNLLAGGKAAEMRVAAGDELAGELSASLLRKLADAAVGPR